ncbi:MAG TPA: ABC transporter ATP-binding protein [Conexivisphaerales archaeon]|nr:ABC transporter ATP-binding protein [Conexivisphaerales archaeon]
MSAPQPYVSLRGIRKAFGSNIALAEVDLDIFPGEVHALLGENGAGKTTLMNVLYGLYKADAGTISVAGKDVKVSGPSDSIALGIFMVHQHFRLIQNFTSLENVMLESGSGLLLDYKASRRKVEETAKAYGLEVDLDAKIKSLPIGAQQRVEILKALSTNPKVLILDEPTSSLTPQEADSVLASVRKFAEKGLGVVFITHKVREVMAVSDRITVLKGGHLVTTALAKSLSENRLVSLMMGGDEATEQLLSTSPSSVIDRRRPEVALAVKGLTVLGGKKEIAVSDVSLTVQKGEILGLAGVSGNGQTELAEAITGVRKPLKGEIFVGSTRVDGRPPRELIKLGVGYVPEDRMGAGLLPSMRVMENLILGHQRDEPFSKKGLMDYNEADSEARQAIEEYSIKARGPEASAGQLSGGNIQKLLIARALLKQMNLVVAHNPTRGLDIKTTDYVLKSLLRQKDEGAGVLLISEDLDELMLVSDSICAIFKGELMGRVERKDFDKYAIGAMMAGRRQEEGGSQA